MLRLFCQLNYRAFTTKNPEPRTQNRWPKILFGQPLIKGNIKSRTAIKLVREWIDLHVKELSNDWELAQSGEDINKIDPLD